MIKIGLLGQCHYTGMALQHMLADLYGQKGEVAVFPLNELHVEAAVKTIRLDYLVISGYQDMLFLSSVNTLLRNLDYDPKRLIVLSEQRLLPLIKHFLTPHCTHFDFIPLEQQCGALHRRLQVALFSPLPRTKTKHIRCLLSSREYVVMKALYSGMSVADLCTELSVSEKTVSAHKLNALEKLHYPQAGVNHHSLVRAALQVS